MPLKCTIDKGLPTKKDDLLRRLIELEARGIVSVEEEVALVTSEGGLELNETEDLEETAPENDETNDYFCIV